MAIKKSVLKQKWYYRASQVFFWIIQILVAIAMLSQGKGIVDIILGFALYTLILFGIWKVFLYIAFGGVEKDELKIS